MSDPQTTADPTVTAWVKAFTAANGRPPDQVPTYERGWYVFRSSLGWETSRDRRAQLAQMTERLWERVNAKA